MESVNREPNVVLSSLSKKELIDLFTNIKVGTKDAIQSDVLGRIYEYFLGQFAKNELQKGGEFYTPACLVRTMVEILEPFKGRIYDPACGSGAFPIGMLQKIVYMLQEIDPEANLWFDKATENVSILIKKEFEKHDLKYPASQVKYVGVCISNEYFTERNFAS